MSSRGKSDGMINNANSFALLGKKKSKGKSLSAAKSGNEKKAVEEKVFWAPAPINTKSWADVDDEDDDDYYATTAPPVAVWGSTLEQVKEETHVEESESDEDILGEEEIDLDEEHDSEPDIQENPEPVVSPVAPVIVVKKPERQLSKKEIKKNEHEELDALFVEFNITPNDKNGHDENQGAELRKKEFLPTGEGEKDEPGTAEPKNSKKKKKKAKSSAKEVKEIQSHEEANAEKAEEDTATVIDVKEQLKKLASMKKKKQSRETDTAAKAAAAEAAARRQKLEAAKKKEKSHHYNQQPVR